MEFPPEPDYDLNQFFSDDSAFDSDPELERHSESESEDGLEEADKQRRNGKQEADVNIEEEHQEDETKSTKKKSKKSKKKEWYQIKL